MMIDDDDDLDDRQHNQWARTSVVWGQVSNLPCGLMSLRIWRKTGVLACNDWEGIGSIIIDGPRLEF
jgi:hypothetical protein